MNNPSITLKETDEQCNIHHFDGTFPTSELYLDVGDSQIQAMNQNLSEFYP